VRVLRNDRSLGAGTIVAACALVALTAGWVSAAAYRKLAGGEADAPPVVIIDVDGIIAGQAVADRNRLDVIVERMGAEAERLSQDGYLVLDKQAVLGFPADGTIQMLGYDDFQADE
jgi:hypothetical protein